MKPIRYAAYLASGVLCTAGIYLLVSGLPFGIVIVMSWPVVSQIGRKLRPKRPFWTGTRKEKLQLGVTFLVIGAAVFYAFGFAPRLPLGRPGPLPLRDGAIMLTALYIILLCQLFMEIRKTKRRAVASLRTDCPDPEFLACLGLPQESEHIALSLRQTLAKSCHIVPEKIKADDSPHDLSLILDEGFDEVCFILDLEKLIGRAIGMERSLVPSLFARRCFWWNSPGATSFGTWIKDFTEVANQATQAIGATAPRPGR